MGSKTELERELERLRARVAELESNALAPERPILPMLGRDIPPLGLLDELPTPVDIRNTRGEVVYVNPAYTRTFNVDHEAVLGKPIQAILSDDFAKAYEIGDDEVLERGTRFTREHVFVSERGPVGLVIEKFPVRDVEGKTVGIGSIVLDVERLGGPGRALEHAVLLNHDRFENSPIPMTDEDWSAAKRMLDALRGQGVNDIREHILEHPEILRELGPAVKILAVNPAAVKVYRAASKKQLLEAFNEIPDVASYNLTTGLADIYVTLLERFYAGETRVELEGPDSALDGSILYIRTTTSIVRGHEDDWARVLQTVEDFTARKEAEDEIRRLAVTDPLTGLANRNRFEGKLVEAIRHARRHGERVSLLLLDLDQFKPVNDRFGHLVGDSVLKLVAERLAEHSRESDLVARIGGDEFAVILANPDNRSAAVVPAQRIIDRLSAPFETMGHQLNIGVSIGIAVFPDDAYDEADLLAKSDRALYEAKRAGRNVYRLYEE